MIVLSSYHNIRSKDELDKALSDHRLGAYVGFDPTANSLHIGHILPLMGLFWLYIHGYPSITLVGGATAQIGDPTDRLKSRATLDDDTGMQNVENISVQLQRLWRNVDSYAHKYGYNKTNGWRGEILNNAQWWKTLPLMEVLRTLGPGMRIGAMLARET